MEVPALGPWLGVVAAPGRGDTLAAARRSLAAGLAELGGAARAAASTGDEEGARRALAAPAWLACWERALDAAAEATVIRIEQRLAAAGARARLPRPGRRALALNAHERAVVRGRCQAGDGRFREALVALEAADDAAWPEAVRHAARRLDGAWRALDAAAEAEAALWEREVARVATLRRPAWPVWAAAVACVGPLLWAGLVVGGWWPVPAAVRPWVERLWGVLP